MRGGLKWGHNFFGGFGRHAVEGGRVQKTPLRGGFWTRTTGMVSWASRMATGGLVDIGGRFE
jgi:hypothetical protein